MPGISHGRYATGFVGLDECIGGSRGLGVKGEAESLGRVRQPPMMMMNDDDFCFFAFVDRIVFWTSLPCLLQGGKYECFG